MTKLADKERLEEIKSLIYDYQNFNNMTKEDEIRRLLVRKHIGWLIQQAELAQQLQGLLEIERFISRSNNTFGINMSKKAERYRETLEFISGEVQRHVYADTLEEARSSARKALEDEIDVLIKFDESIEEEGFTIDYNRNLEEVKFVVDLDGYDLIESDEVDRLLDIERDYVELRSNL